MTGTTRGFPTRDWGTVLLRTMDYNLGGMAVRAESAEGEPIAALSVWVEQTPTLPPNCFYLKDWSENERIAEDLMRSGWVKPRRDLPGVLTGFVAAEVYELLDIPLTPKEVAKEFLT